MFPSLGCTGCSSWSEGSLHLPPDTPWLQDLAHQGCLGSPLGMIGAWKPFLAVSLRLLPGFWMYFQVLLGSQGVCGRRDPHISHADWIPCLGNHEISWLSSTPLAGARSTAWTSSASPLSPAMHCYHYDSSLPTGAGFFPGLQRAFCIHPSALPSCLSAGVGTQAHLPMSPATSPASFRRAGLVVLLMYSPRYLICTWQELSKYHFNKYKKPPVRVLRRGSDGHFPSFPFWF